MWSLNKLPQVWHPFFRNDRFARVTDDAFFLGIEARDRRFDAEKTHAAAQGRRRDRDRARLPTIRIRRRSAMPKWITAFIVASTAFALIPFAIAAKARNSHSSEPHIHIFPDMDFQPKYKSDTAMDMFADGRANRGEIAGHGRARLARRPTTLFYRGLETPRTAPKWTTGFPKTYPDGRAVRGRRELLAARPEPLQHLLHAVPRLRRPRQGMVPERVKLRRRPVAGAQPRRGAGRDGQGRRRRADAERPALQHDLERLQHDDGLRRPDPARGSVGDRRVRPRPRSARRTPRRTTSRADQQGSIR